MVWLWENKSSNHDITWYYIIIIYLYGCRLLRLQSTIFLLWTNCLNIHHNSPRGTYHKILFNSKYSPVDLQSLDLHMFFLSSVDLVPQTEDKNRWHKHIIARVKRNLFDLFYIDCVIIRSTWHHFTLQKLISIQVYKRSPEILLTAQTKITFFSRSTTHWPKYKSRPSNQ